MSRLRIALVLAFAFGACRAVPSATPLADTGVGRDVDDGALGRNRVPLAKRKPGAPEPRAETRRDADEKVEIVASKPEVRDAGAPEAGTTTSDAGDGGVLWAGEYFGSDRHVVRATGEQDKIELDDKAHTRVEQPSASAVIVSLVSSSDGQVICAMRMSVTGNRAALEPGASCPGLFLMPPLAVTGSAEVDGDQLEVELEARGEFPAGSETLAMDVEYHFAGKRR